MQSTLIAGDSLNFLQPGGTYPASAGWTLNFRLVPRGAGSPVTFQATAEGNDYRVSVSAAATAAWPAGGYGWASWVTKGAESHTVEQGQIAVAPDPRTASAGVDSRTMAARAVEELKAAFAEFTRTNGRTRRYKINEREMEFNSTADIIKQIKYWEGELTKEDIAAGRKSAFSGRILARI